MHLRGGFDRGSKSAMEMLNAIVDCDVARLNIPLRPWFARQGHGFVAMLRRVPADVAGVYAAIYNNGTTPAYHAAECRPDGSWVVRIPHTAFPAVAESKYEVHGVAADGQPCALGEGRLQVQSFGEPANN